VVAHTETLLVSDHPVCAGCGGFAAFSYWRSLPSSRAGEYATPKYVTVIPKCSTLARVFRPMNMNAGHNPGDYMLSAFRGILQ
jgi:hypothetical protein